MDDVITSALRANLGRLESSVCVFGLIALEYD